MALQRHWFRVWLTGDDPADAGRLVEVTNDDMYVAEERAARMGIPANEKTSAVRMMTLWVWVAMHRTGDTAATFTDFRAAQLVGIQADKDEPVDPTQPAGRSPSDSLSHVFTETPATGLDTTSLTGS